MLAQPPGAARAGIPSLDAQVFGITGLAAKLITNDWTQRSSVKQDLHGIIQ
jgi:hypothetical protein